MIGIADTLRAHGVSHAIADSLQKFIGTQDPLRLYYIQPYVLADQWRVDPREMLSAFIVGSHEDIFTLRWDYHCPECHSIAERHNHLSESSLTCHCGLCGVDFTNALDKNVEVSFYVSKNMVHYPPDIDERFRNGMAADYQREKRFVSSSSKVVTGLDCFNLSLFREVFGDDILTPDQSMEIGHIAVMFTDIKGSTALYEKIGDVKAFKAVRDHFTILFGAVDRNGGAVVKTIGDAIMASFSTNQQALSAALEIGSTFMDGSDDLTKLIGLKIGIHAGPCIAVTLNGRMDYFGTTVNTAARIQGQAGAGEIWVSDILYNCPQCASLIGKYMRQIYKTQKTLKGLAGSHELYVIPLGRRQDRR